jgi:hypothetical protein
MKFYDGKTPKEGDIVLHMIHNNYLNLVLLTDNQKDLILSCLKLLGERITVFEDSEIELEIERMLKEKK